ncbi:MFS transporter [Bifidobacterium avesanii]|uniref:MFS transporter n=1 Tax=Bifidobacterium avesanii TaxID=1798157 RepID=UPI001382FE95|nr:MFS transporter [Bifidobacterium avesanii]KAB8291050.1 multidrug-efflux transporter [Bifidobacterium avesanii]
MDRRSATAGRVRTSGDAEAPNAPGRDGRFPWRSGLSLMVGGAGWMWAFTSLHAVLLPAKIQLIDPVNKISIVAMVSTVTMLISLLAGMGGGMLSDRTRTRIGSRSPWLIGGVMLGTALLAAFAFCDSLPVVLAVWWAYGAVYNVMLSAGCAWQPDQVAPRWRGTVSSMYGVGRQFGLQGAQIVAAMFVTNISLGVVVALCVFDVLSLAAVAINGERSNRDAPRPARTNGGLRSRLAMFLPPAHAGRDYWLAAVLLFLWMLPGGIGLYRLYTLTDYMGQSDQAAGWWIGVMSVPGLVLAIGFCAVSGPIADRFSSVRIPLALAIFSVGLPCWLPFFVPTPMAYAVYFVLSSFGGGIFTALDQSIMVDVLPNPTTRAHDLAFLNACGALGNLCAPLLAGALVKAFGYASLFPMGFAVLTAAAACVLCFRGIR